MAAGGRRYDYKYVLTFSPPPRCCLAAGDIERALEELGLRARVENARDTNQSFRVLWIDPSTDTLPLPGSAVSLVINGRTYTATIRPTHEDGRADSIPLSQQVSERDHDNVGGVHVQQRLHLPSGANGTEAVSHTQQARVSGYASRRGSESRSSGRSRLPPPVAILDRAQSSGPVPLHGRRECCTSGSQVTGEDEHVKRLLFAGVPDGTCKEALFSLMQLCSVEGIASVSNVVKNRVVVEFKQEVDITATRERCRQINEICRSGHNITVGTVPAPRHILVTYQLERERVAERAMEAFQWFQPVASKMQSLCSAMLTFKDADVARDACSSPVVHQNGLAATLLYQGLDIPTPAEEREADTEAWLPSDVFVRFQQEHTLAKLLTLPDKSRLMPLITSLNDVLADAICSITEYGFKFSPTRSAAFNPIWKKALDVAMKFWWKSVQPEIDIRPLEAPAEYLDCIISDVRTTMDLPANTEIYANDTNGTLEIISIGSKVLSRVQLLKPKIEKAISAYSTHQDSLYVETCKLDVLRMTQRLNHIEQRHMVMFDYGDRVENVTSTPITITGVRKHVESAKADLQATVNALIREEAPWTSADLVGLMATEWGIEYGTTHLVQRQCPAKLQLHNGKVTVLYRKEDVEEVFKALTEVGQALKIMRIPLNKPRMRYQQDAVCNWAHSRTRRLVGTRLDTHSSPQSLLVFGEEAESVDACFERIQSYLDGKVNKKWTVCRYGPWDDGSFKDYMCWTKEAVGKALVAQFGDTSVNIHITGESVELTGPEDELEFVRAQFDDSEAQYMAVQEDVTEYGVALFAQPGIREQLSDIARKNDAHLQLQHVPRAPTELDKSRGRSDPVRINANGDESRHPTMSQHGGERVDAVKVLLSGRPDCVQEAWEMILDFIRIKLRTSATYNTEPLSSGELERFVEMAAQAGMEIYVNGDSTSIQLHGLCDIVSSTELTLQCYLNTAQQLKTCIQLHKSCCMGQDSQSRVGLDEEDDRLVVVDARMDQATGSHDLPGTAVELSRQDAPSEVLCADWPTAALAEEAEQSPCTISHATSHRVEDIPLCGQSHLARHPPHPPACEPPDPSAQYPPDPRVPRSLSRCQAAEPTATGPAAAPAAAP
eukprot:scpid33262/ scgid2026/ 